jgi:predicted nucleic-acid-binding Zn-ribbon protein
MIINRLSCPKCNSTKFEVYLVVIEDFFQSGRPIAYIMHKCIDCGWESAPRDKEKIREVMIKMMTGKGYEEAFKLEENDKK